MHFKKSCTRHLHVYYTFYQLHFSNKTLPNGIAFKRITRNTGFTLYDARAACAETLLVAR